MKVLYITPHLSTGGAPRYLLEKIKLLNDSCEIYCIEYNDITGGVLVVQRSEIASILGNKLITIGENKMRVVDEIKRIAPDVIHFEEMPEYFCSYEVAEAIYNINRTYKIFETSHDSSFNPDNKLFFPDKFLFVSEYQRQMMASVNVDSEVVEFPITYKKKSNRLTALKKLDLDPNLVHIINIGLFTARKNQKELIEYARKLTNLPVQFHFIGSLADNFKYYWEDAIKDLPPNCKIWGERSDVDNFYDAADFFFFASRGFEHDKETSPLVIKECIGWNLPIFLYNLPVYCNMYNKYDNMMFLSLDKDVNISMLKEKIVSVYDEVIGKHIDSSHYSLNFDMKEDKFWISCLDNPMNNPEVRAHLVFKDVDSLTTFYSMKNHKFAKDISTWVLPMGSPVNFGSKEDFRGFIVDFYDLNYKLLFSKEHFIRNTNRHPDKIEFSLHNPFDRTFWNYQEFFIFKNIEKEFPTLNLNNLGNILDLGANNGIFIEKMLRLGAQKIHGFEPSPNALSNLNHRYGSNDKVTIVNKAVSDNSGKLTFYYHPDNSTISAFDKNHITPHLPENEILNCEVETIKLDEYCASQNINIIDLIKIDVEGAEYMILQSLNKDFYSKVKNLLVEIHENTNDKVKNLISHLRSCGFEINSFAIGENPCSEAQLLNSANGMFLATNKNISDKLVTVIIPTFNHEKYIEQCVDSVLMQKNIDKINILIANDGSTDRTSSVLEKYKNLNNVTILHEEKNVGPVFSRFNNLLSRCKTKYVTFLDGDDYYLVDNKIELQIDFLEKNNDYVLHSPVFRYHNDNNLRHSLIKELSFEKNVFANYVSCGVMYRNDILQNNFHLLKKYDCEEVFDFYWIYPLLMLQFGKGYNEQNGPAMAVYRLHQNSEFSHLEERQKRKRVFKQGKKLGEIHDADILHTTLKIKRNKNVIDFYTQTREASFEGYIDIYDAMTNEIIIKKRKINFSAFSIEDRELDPTALNYNWSSVDIINDINIKIDFFDRNLKFIFSRKSNTVKAAIAADVFFHTESNLDNFIDYTTNMKKTGLPILLMTNSKFDSKVIDYVDYLIYDKEDRLFKHEYKNYKTLILFFSNQFHNFQVPTLGKQKHGLSVLSNFYRALVFLKSLNYTHIIKTEADCMIEDTNRILEELQNVVDSDKKGLVYLHNDNGDLFTSYHIMYFEIDYLLSVFPQINNEKDYQNYICDEKFLSAEELLTNIIKPKMDEIIVKDSNLTFTDYGKNSSWNRILSPVESDKIINGCIPNVFRVYENDVLIEDSFGIAIIDMSSGQKNECKFIVEIEGIKKEYDFSIDKSNPYRLELIKFDKKPTKVTIVKENFKKIVNIVDTINIDNVLRITK
jgi:glycosyltransferase involved in cell wall biosynthesis/ribosomal protein L33